MGVRLMLILELAVFRPESASNGLITSAAAGSCGDI